MPHGYECDRCETFQEVEQFAKATPDGRAERVTIHPPTESDSTYSVNDYTLCERCRAELINEIESFDLGECGLKER
jgi:hypothetical protein